MLDAKVVGKVMAAVAEKDFNDEDSSLELKVSAGNVVMLQRMKQVAARNNPGKKELTEAQLMGIYSAMKKFTETIDALLQISFPAASEEELLSALLR